MVDRTSHASQRGRATAGSAGRSDAAEADVAPNAIQTMMRSGGNLAMVQLSRESDAQAAAGPTGADTVDSPYREDESGRRGVRVGHSDHEELNVSPSGQILHQRDQRSSQTEGSRTESSRQTRDTAYEGGRYSQRTDTEEHRRDRLHERSSATEHTLVENEDGSGESTTSSRTDESRYRGQDRTEERADSRTVTEADGSSETESTGRSTRRVGPRGLIRSTEEETEGHASRDADGATRSTERRGTTTRHAGGLLRDESRSTSASSTEADGAEETTTVSASERRGPRGMLLNREHAASASRTEADGSTTSASTRRSAGRRGLGVGGESRRERSHRDAEGAGRTEARETSWTAGLRGVGGNHERSATNRSADGSSTTSSMQQGGSVDVMGAGGPTATQSGRVSASGDSEQGHSEAAFEHSASANYSARVEPVRDDGELVCYVVVVRLHLQGSLGGTLGVRPRTDAERGAPEESEDSRNERQLTGALRPDQRGAHGTLGLEARGNISRTWETRHRLSPEEVQPYLTRLHQAEQGRRLNNELPEHVALRTGSLAHIQRLGRMEAGDAARLQEHEGTTREGTEGGALGGHVGVGRGDNAIQLGMRVTGSGTFRMQTRGLGGGRLSVTLTERRQRGTEVNAQGSVRGRSLGGSYNDATDSTFAMTFELDQNASDFRDLYNALDSADSAADIRRFAQAHADLVRGQTNEDASTTGGSASLVRVSASYERRRSATRSFEITEEEDDDREGDVLITVTARSGSSSGETVGGSIDGVQVTASQDQSRSNARAVTFRLSRNAPNFEQLRDQIHALQTQDALRTYQHAHAGMVENVELDRQSSTEAGLNVAGPEGAPGLRGQRVGTMRDQTAIAAVEGEDGTREQRLTGRVRANNTRTSSLNAGQNTLVGGRDTGSVDFAVNEDGEVEGQIMREDAHSSILQAIGSFGWDAWNHPGTVFRELRSGIGRDGFTATMRTAVQGRLREVVHSMGLRINTHDFNVIAERAHNRSRWTEAGTEAGGVTQGFPAAWEQCRRGLLQPHVNGYEAGVDRQAALLLAKFRVIGRLQQQHTRAATALMNVAYRWGGGEGVQTERVGTREEWPNALQGERERYAQMLRSTEQIAGLYNDGHGGDTTNARYRRCQQQLTRLLGLFRRNEGEFTNANAYLQMTQALRAAQGTLTEARDRHHARNSRGADSAEAQAAGQQPVRAGGQRANADGDGAGGQQEEAADRAAQQRRLRQAGTRIWPIKQQETRLLRQINEERQAYFSSTGRVIQLLRQLVELYEESFVAAVLHIREAYQDANVSESDWKVGPQYGRPRQWDPNMYWARSLADETTRRHRAGPDEKVERINACMRSLG